MKKSSAWCMLVPGLVILFLFLMIPLLRVLVPSVFTGDYPFSAYVDFFKDEYYRKIFLRTVKIAVITTFVCYIMVEIFEVMSGRYLFVIVLDEAVKVHLNTG